MVICQLLWWCLIWLPSGIAQQAKMEVSRCLKVLVFLRTWLCKSLTPWVMALFYKTLVPNDTHPLDCNHGHRTSSFKGIFSTGAWPRGCSSLSPKEERVLAMEQHRQSLKLVSYHGITTREQQAQNCTTELEKSTAKGNSSIDHDLTKRPWYHRVCRITPNKRDELGPGSTRGLQSGAKGEGAADIVGDKLQHVTEGLQLATE